MTRQNTPPPDNTTQTPVNPPAGTNPPPANPPAQPAVDVQAEIAKAKVQWEADAKAKADEEKLKAQGEYQKIAETKEVELQKAKAELAQTKVRSEILAYSNDAQDADTVHALLAGKAKVDDNGAVTIDGKPVKDAIAQLLKDKPFLAKATGNQGSGSAINTQSAVKQMSRADFLKLSPAEQMKFSVVDKGQVTE